MSFQPLYSNDKKGNVREWIINVNNMGNFSEITISHGNLNGKHILKTIKIDKGKNIGKKNETTHYEQAMSEATSKWTKKKDIEKYTTTISNNTTNEKSNVISSPMLAHEYFKFKNKLQFPCYIQRKLDGYRLLYDNVTQDMYTRNGKKYTILYNSDLHKQLIELNLPFDGELYCHDDFNFEFYGVLRKKTLSTDDLKLINKIKYHVYDLHIPNKTYKERYDILTNTFKTHNTSKLELVESIICNNDKDILKHHQSFIQDNYEGSILRNLNGHYASKRSFDLLKYKDFNDDEFKIVDYTFEKNEDQNLIIWICKTSDDKIFNVRPSGTIYERVYLYKNASEFIGQNLWVKYFGKTENMIPRFPNTKTSTYLTYIRNEII